jgi:hypothetical protein
MTVYCWRIDQVTRARDGSVLTVLQGPVLLAYDRACAEFDAAFQALDPGHSVRLLRADFDMLRMCLTWVPMREGWQGRE